jgi:hypothetical protein
LNVGVLKSFEKNGYNIKHYPDSGFHLVVYDKQISLLVVNNPENIKERSGIIITNKGLSKAFRDYFYSVWKKASKIS